MGRLRVHALLYGLVLTVMAAVIPLGASFGSDDGAYGGEVYALRHGSWILARPVPVVGVDNEGWLNSAITPAGPLPYTTNPAYPRLLQGVAAVASAVGIDGPGLVLHLPGLAATWLSACLAWLLAARWNRRAAPLAFWLLGLGPVVVNATALWAHSLSTAVGGLAMLAALHIHDRSMSITTGAGSPSDPADVPPRPGRAGWARVPTTLIWSVVLVVALAAGAAIRTEAMFWAGAVAVTAVVIDRRRTMVAAVSAAGMAAGAVWLLDRAWGQSIRADRLPIATAVEALMPGSWLGTRLPAGARLLLAGPDAGISRVLGLGAVFLVGYTMIVLRRERELGPGRTATVTLALAAACYLAKAVVAQDQLMPGVLTAWPLLPVALLAGRHQPVGPAIIPPPASASSTFEAPPAPAVPPSDRRPLAAEWLLAPVGLLLAAVLATQYGDSGGMQWGGRYLSMAFVPLAAAAALRGQSLFRAGLARRLALTALAVAPAAAGVTASYRLHTTHASVVAVVTATPAEVVVTEIGALPRVAWPALPTAFYRADATTIEPLLSQLAAAGVRTVNVQGLADTDIDGMAGYQVRLLLGPIRHLELEPGGVATPARAEAPAELRAGAGAEALTPSPGAPAAGP